MTEAARRAWDAEADRFDDQPDHGLQDPVARRAWTVLLGGILPPPPVRVLDLGCGTGSLTVLLGELGHEVSGVDLSPRMVERAEQKAARHGVRACFQVGDAGDPQVQGLFDVVLARHLLWALPDAARALDRWTGLLREGGALVLVEGFWHTGVGWRADDLLPLVRDRTGTASLQRLSEKTDLWGAPVTDERYLVLARTRTRRSGAAEERMARSVEEHHAGAVPPLPIGVRAAAGLTTARAPAG